MPIFAALTGAQLADEAVALRGIVRGVAAAVLRLKPDHPDVEDCASETLRRAIEGESRLRKGQQHRPWIIGIARHVALDMLRARARTRFGDDLAGDESSTWAERLPDRSPGPDELLERAERCEEIQRAVANLPEVMQTALIKFHVEGKSYQRIAQEMNVPLGTVATWVARGRKIVAEGLRFRGRVE